MKFRLEKLFGKGNFIYIGEYNTTRALADAMNASPAKTRNAVQNMRRGQWNRLGEYRIAIID